MNDWFDIEQVDQDTYMISEYGHPEKVHSYLLLDDSLAYMIDTGLGIGKIKQVTDNLTTLPIKVLTTHVHWDHVGGHGLYETIMVHKAEANWMIEGMPRTPEQIRSFVLDGPVTKPYPPTFDIDNYVPFKGKPSYIFEHDEILSFGKRKLSVLHTPGHSPGHICIYEADRGYLFTGDLIYKGELYAHLAESDPEEYLGSIKKVNKLEHLTRLLPSHNEIIETPHLIGAIQEAFMELKNRSCMQKGSGLYDFIDFKIRL